MHYIADDLESGEEALALTDLIRLERLLAAHAGFEEYLREHADD